MPRFKNYNDQQTTMIPISLEDQITEGVFEFAKNDQLENEPDLSGTKNLITIKLAARHNI